MKNCWKCCFNPCDQTNDTCGETTYYTKDVYGNITKWVEPSDIIKPIINKEADMVIGSRYLGKIHYSIPSHIKIGEYFIKKILKLFYNEEIANNQSGFRAIHKSLLTHFKEFYDCTRGPESPGGRTDYQ